MLTDTIPCRLCDGSAEYVFTLPILGRIQAGYYRCRECGSLLTETPSWLEQAYGYPGTTVDVGSALRPLQNWLFLAATFDRLGLPRSARYIDVGANTGLLTRLMRYSGFDFVSYEKYVVPYYSDYDVIASLKDERCFGVTAFEVLEHFALPKAELAAIFATGPSFVVASTMVYDDQGADWPYLAPYCGQHVFFYSARALESLGARHGYQVSLGGLYQLFVKRELAEEERFRGLREALLAPNFTDPALGTVLAGVIVGNQHIENDYQQALARFQRELGGPPPEPGARGRDTPLEAQLLELAHELHRLSQTRTHDQAELSRLTRQLELMSTSTSWRVTAPLRWLRRVWRGEG